MIQSEALTDCEQLLEQAPWDKNASLSFERLMKRYDQALNAYASHLLGTGEGGQDIVQETWMALYLYAQQQAPDWATDANIPGWLWRVTKNKALNYQKKRQRQRSLDAQQTVFLCEPRIPRFDYPEDAAIREDTQHALYKAVRALPTPQREAITYRFFYEWSLDEIVQELGIPLNTVKARLARGKKQLQRLLAEQGVEGRDLDAWALERSPKITLRE